jgi:hypothetical protein
VRESSFFRAYHNHISQVLAKHRFENLLLRDIAIVPTTDLILIVARVMHKDMLPKTGRAEKQLIRD